MLSWWLVQGFYYPIYSGIILIHGSVWKWGVTPCFGQHKWTIIPDPNGKYAWIKLNFWITSYFLTTILAWMKSFIVKIIPLVDFRCCHMSLSSPKLFKNIRGTWEVQNVDRRMLCRNLATLIFAFALWFLDVSLEKSQEHSTVVHAAVERKSRRGSRARLCSFAS